MVLPIGLTAAALAANAAIQKRMLGSGILTLIISNGKINDIVKIAKSLKRSNLLIKGLSKTTKNGAKRTIRRIFQYIIRYIRY